MVGALAFVVIIIAFYFRNFDLDRFIGLRPNSGDSQQNSSDPQLTVSETDS